MEESVLLEMTGTVERIVFHNETNQYTVMEVNCGDELIVVVGAFPFVHVGESLLIYGKWGSHSKYGEQFIASAFERIRPSTVEEMLKYLSSGAVKGIGPALAKRIVDAFGEQAMQVIEHDPERLSQIKGITRKKALEIHEELQKTNGIRQLMLYFGSFGIAPQDAILIWKRFGNSAIQCVQEDPYVICQDDIGIDFAVADKIALSMDKQIDNPDRIKAGIKYVLRHNLSNGHVCLPQIKLCQAAANMLGVNVDLAEAAICQMYANYSLVQISFDETTFAYLPHEYQCEKYIADRLKLMLRYPPQHLSGVAEDIDAFEQQYGLRYAEKQKEAIFAALEQGVLILTGGPGTGKTTTLNAIIQMLKRRGEAVLLAAPTGRAAKRMSELTGEEAKTIHRLLQVEWNEQDKIEFKRNESNPLECDCVVIDELSMVDNYALESVLRALPLSCRLIFVGDTDQLPSVGAGNVLGDLISCGLFHTVQLDEIFRQSMQSLIVSNAHEIVQGRMPELNSRDRDFFFLPSREYDATVDLIVSLCQTRLPNTYGYSSVSDIQVLCPSRKGRLGTEELNLRLREAINPTSPGKIEVNVHGVVFRVGDKVMHNKNNYHIPWEKEDGTRGEGVFNGDMGIIAMIDKPGEVIGVYIDDKIVTYEFEQAYAELELAYAITIHKSQGNEFTAAIIPVLGTTKFLCYRNLLYTGITRAKSILLLVGSRNTIRDMVENDRRTKRFTGLSHFLKDFSVKDEI